VENVTTDKTQWLSRSDAARVLGLSAAMVDVLLRQGRLKFEATRLGRLIDPVSVESLRREREARAAQ
jgi:hypothetical protein